MINYEHVISMKFQLSEEECEAIKGLEDACHKEQRINLKLELDFKIHQIKNSIKNKIMTEFLYYENEKLIGYLGLCSFSGDTVEVSGMVHPKFRRRGIFKKLYLLAKEEWERICEAQVLVLCDHTSLSGLAFINSLGAEYSSSEYKMYLNKKTLHYTSRHGIELRMAAREDVGELKRQDSIYFGLELKEVDNDNAKENIEEIFALMDDSSTTYLAEIEGNIIGKIRIDTSDNEGSIYGFGVLPDFRGRGYGREILCSAIDILKKKHLDSIFLEVATENKNALGLYESCGFEQVSVMDYYIVS